VKNEHEESKEIPKKGSLFMNLEVLFSKNGVQKIDLRKINTIMAEILVRMFSVCLHFVQKKDC